MSFKTRFFDKNPDLRKVTIDIHRFYKYNSFLMYPLFAWYILCAIPQVTTHFPPNIFIVAMIFMLLLDIGHIFLMLMILRRAGHSKMLRSVEREIIIIKKNQKKRSLVRLHYGTIIPVVLYTVGAIILIMTFLLQIKVINDIDLSNGNTSKNGLLSNVMSIVGLVVSIIRIVVNRKFKRHAKSLMHYANRYPKE